MKPHEPSLHQSLLLAVLWGALATAAGWYAVHGSFRPEHVEADAPAAVSAPSPVEEEELPRLFVNGRAVTSLDEIRAKPNPRSPETLKKAYEVIGEKRFDQYRALREQAAAAARRGVASDLIKPEDIDYMEREGLIAW